jgi:hypothetical protein
MSNGAGPGGTATITSANPVVIGSLAPNASAQANFTALLNTNSAGGCINFTVNVTSSDCPSNQATFCVDVPPCEPCDDLTQLPPPSGAGPWYYCIQFCPGLNQICIGPLHPYQMPVSSFLTGCDHGLPGCDVDCPPAICDPIGGWYYDPLTSNWYLDVQSQNFGCCCLCIDEILPVELSSYEAIPGDRSVTLLWETASETDNDHFDIARNGHLVGRVNANGAATGARYEWTDSDLTNGTEYSYTVSSVDVSGNAQEIFTISAAPSFNAATVTEYALHQNFPNPFNPETNITFDLVDAGFVNLSVYNLLGQQIAVVVNSTMDAGRHVVSFNSGNLTSGLYLYRIEANGFTAQKKMVLMK